MANCKKPLSETKKHYTSAEKQQKELEEEIIIVGNEQLYSPPKWLTDKLAIEEFNRLVNEYKKIEIVGNLDLNNIACYCNAYASYRQATDELSVSTLTIEKPLPNGSTQIVENPLIKIQKNYADEMRKFGSKCGLDISSRLKAAATKTTQMNEDIAEEFGDC